jgi:hypothetical protein
VNFEDIVTQLVAQRDRLNQAIEALGGWASSAKNPGPNLNKPRRGRPPKSGLSSTAAPKRRTMSAAARKKIAAAQRARWAAQKAKEKRS